MGFVVLSIIVSLLGFIPCCFLIFAKKYHLKIETIFLVLGLLIGSFYALFIPIGRNPDEDSHFFRIYEITEGQFVSTTDNSHRFPGSFLPKNLLQIRKANQDQITYSEIANNLLAPPSEERTFIENSAYIYHPFAYPPQTAGVLVGQVFHLPLLITAYLGRFFGLFFYIGILFVCVKHIPFLKNLIFFITFLPLVMQSLVSLSADGMILVSTISLITFILHSIYTRKDNLTIKHFFILLIICFFICMNKIVYAPLCLLIFCIPNRCFGKKGIQKKLLHILGIIGIIGIAYLIWFSISPSLVTVSNSSEQISAIISYPISYSNIIFHSISYNSDFYLSDIFGDYSERFLAQVSLYLWISFIIFILLCNKSRTTYTIPRSLKITSIVIFTSITIAIFTVMLVSFTEQNETVIFGVQGRYFFPILLLIPLFLLPTPKSPSQCLSPLKSETHSFYLYAFLIFESIYSILSIVSVHT